MATIYRRSDSKFWWARIKNPTGGPPLRKPTGITNKRNAQVYADKLEGDLCVALPPFPLGQALSEAREQQLVDNRAESTLERGRVSGAHLIRILGGDLDLNAIQKPAKVVEHYLKARRAEGADDHTISKELRFLCMGLRRAKEELKEFFGEPKQFFPRVLSDCYVPRDRYLTKDEFGVLLEAERVASERYPWAVTRRDWLIFYVTTGCRQNEIHLIEKKHVDMKRRIVRIPTPKTSKGGAAGKIDLREVPLQVDAMPIVERRLAMPGKMLFTPRWQRGRMHANLKRWCAAADIDPVSSNDLRRTFATWMAEAGVPEARVEKYMGHKNSRMLRRVYQQLTQQQHDDTRERFGSVLESYPESATPIEKAWEYRTPQNL